MFDVNAIAGLKIESGDFSMLGSDMPTSTVVYLLSNGFSQSLTDARTTAQAKVLSDAVKAWAKEFGREPTVAERAAIKVAAQADMEAAGTAAMAKRMDALWEGTMVYGARGPNGPRKTPEEAYLWARAEADGKAVLSSKGISHPKGADLEAMVQKVLSKRGDAYRKEWAKKQANSDGLDDILGI